MELQFREDWLRVDPGGKAKAKFTVIPSIALFALVGYKVLV
jgi:hypothetical protein